MDFDGTLSPIARDPKDAALPSDVKSWLRNLSQKKRVKIVIVTGRALTDIRQKVGLKNIIYAANHGMEIYCNGRYLLRKGGVYKKPLQALADELDDSLSGIHGAIVENKKLSVAVHFRNASARSRVTVKKIAKKLSESYLEKYGLQLTTGKMIIEIRPAKFWNKGKAVFWIWQRLAPKHTPIYIGDDVTDEDAFQALRPYGPTIRIGKNRNSHAEYFLKSIKDVI